ncbi:FAD-dependent oxidoreductase [Clostridium estertheticum]|uniref:NAD(P)/FAD-dependent oxidoreductase n=1 Tax=Clostridium estertheticum TaxID=238834 RepID=UPI001CF59DBA|nr:FAD-dependent oxidoreductase [Clostridium estertheticum]MCB2305923.1 FAD-dependent oxidoreductase [Clostridium estertheticum]MCB2345608.1 FAD-dependent oxidoreductase [Clostridium estertheticum]MCB2349105.1 FAD-dependent oxidoreductase [Clostridium estertheticum]WAG47742.1 FAD-dependent oxidoreductase [Clostridium estertheticum]
MAKTIITKKIIIVGSGITAITAIKAIREIDLDSDICLIGEEKFYPYTRIKLSKSLFAILEENNILIQKKEWYEQNNVKILINTKVVSIDSNSHEVSLSNGSNLSYDKLLIATGASNNVPPIDGIGMNGVYTLRGLNDALNIKEKLNENTNAIILGGGILGLEMAFILHQHNIKVTIVELCPRLMPRQLDDKASEILKSKIQACGIQILTNTCVNKIIGTDNKVEGILINEDVELKCDIVIHSIGIKPNMDLILKTDIKRERGILVNNKMETNIKDIYAAGDIAEFDNQVIGLWNIAISQGKVAGYNISGRDAVYEKITPVTMLNAFGISLFSMGCIEESSSTKVLSYEDINGTGYKKIFIKNNKIIGAIVIGDARRSPLLKSAIEKELPLDGINLSNISVDDLLDKLKK